MKTIKFLSFSVLFVSLCSLSFGQTKKESFKVSGNCGMCKTSIEKAAKSAGASYASWNEETKVLEVKYNSRTSNAAKIQQSIAGVGYDTPGFKATDASYDKLHGCCKYEREEGAARPACCAENCEMKDGKCASMEKCKANDCCKDEAACKASGCCAKEGHPAGAAAASGKCEMKNGKCTDMTACKDKDCCKSGKCEMAGHAGKDCCKKS